MRLFCFCLIRFLITGISVPDLCTSMVNLGFGLYRMMPNILYILWTFSCLFWPLSLFGFYFSLFYFNKWHNFISTLFLVVVWQRSIQCPLLLVPTKCWKKGSVYDFVIPLHIYQQKCLNKSWYIGYKKWENQNETLKLLCILKIEC